MNSTVDFRRDKEKPSFHNFISPNGDGKNDFIQIFENSTIKDYQLQIFNRWGKLIFESTLSSEPWDAQNLTEGTYFYGVKYQNCEGNLIKHNGYVQVLR